MSLTKNQQAVLDEFRKVCRKNACLYRETQPHLHQRDLEKLAIGDQACVFSMGGLSYQAAPRHDGFIRAQYLQGASAKGIDYS